MNSKKLFKTLLWSLAGLTLVLTGCTKKGPSSSTSSPSSPSTGGTSSSPIGGSDSSGSQSDTPVPQNQKL